MKTAFLLACGTVVPFGFLILGAVLIWRNRHRLRRWRDALVYGGIGWPRAGRASAASLRTELSGVREAGPAALASS